MKNVLFFLSIGGLIAGTIFLLSYITNPQIEDKFDPKKMAAFFLEQVKPAQVGELKSDTEVNVVLTSAAELGYIPNDIDAIRQKLAERFSLTVEQVQITLGTDSTSEFATGLVNVGEGDKGGIYFAAKTETGWEIAHDGRGILECSQANKYGFPTGLIPRCFDLETGLNVDR